VRSPPLKALRAFEAAARLESFLLAAEELHVTPSAVSYQIKILEEYVGLSLFERLSRGIVLTDAGRSYFVSIHGAFEHIREATERTMHGSANSRLVLRVASSFSVKWLLPRLASFVALNPDIDVRIDTRNHAPAAGGEVADVEIRFGDGQIADMHVEALVTERFVPMCSPHLLDAPNALRSLDDLRKFPLIHTRTNLVPWSNWLSANGVNVAHDLRELFFDRAFMAIEAAVNGLGIVLEGDFLARPELESGALVEPFRGMQKELRTCRHFLVYPHSRAEIPKIQAFSNWIRERLRAEAGERVTKALPR
jgi:LysR family transcriptional regulator, glycine cleavage system transcriptional activator